MINGHGNNLYDYAGKITADFSSNIAFNNHSAAIIFHLKEHLTLITNYPDPTARILTEKLARHHGVSPSQILVTNGSAEAFYLVAHLFQGAHTTICTPAFAEYEDACTLYQHQITFLPLAELSSLAKYATNPDTPDSPNNLKSNNPQAASSLNTVWFGSPNNPDGQITPAGVITQMCREYPDRYFIIDCAYTTLASEASKQPNIPSICSEANSCSNWAFNANSNPIGGHQVGSAPFLPANLLSIHSLTKAFAIPGIRLGYLIAAPEIISKLSRMRPPWGVNALSLEAGTYILDHYNTLLPSLEELNTESQFLQKALSQIPGIEVIPSRCNFFLSRLCKINPAIKVNGPDDLHEKLNRTDQTDGLHKKFSGIARTDSLNEKSSRITRTDDLYGMNDPDAAALKKRLIEEYGILIRDCSNFRGLSPFHFRIAAQTRPENEALIRALREILQA